MKTVKCTSHLDSKILWDAIKGSFRMLNPGAQIGNPVMFVAYLAAILITLHVAYELIDKTFSWFNFQIALWLWFTVLFANFAQAIAEGRGKAQAASLKRTKIDNYAKLIKGGKEVQVPFAGLIKGNVIKCEAGDVIPADGEVIQGIATVDESAITGESAPVIRESGGDRSAVTAGTRVISDQIMIKVTCEPGNSFLDKIIHLIEGAKRQKTPNEIALTIVLAGLSIVFLITTISLKFFADYTEVVSKQDLSQVITIPILVALLVCLIPTTIGALLSAVGIAGMDRLISRNVIAKSGRSVEAAGDIDLLILDKTGTITLGNRMATDFIPAHDNQEKLLAEIAQLASLSDETAEGRSIVVLAKKKFDLRAPNLDVQHSKFIPFTAQTRMSGVDYMDDQEQVIRSIRKGAADSIKDYIEKKGGTFPQQLYPVIESISNKGGTPLLVSDNDQVIGMVYLKDVIKGGIRERFSEMRKMGITTLMVTGDNPLTAAAIAAEAGVDDFIAEATPEMKLQRIREEQQKGRLVAMTGDGTNDAPALAQADVGVAMNTGTQASREAGNMVDLDSNPTKLIEIVEIGKQLLMTRGALTTFSIANDVAKYFAIIPAIFGTVYRLPGETKGPLSFLNIMRLETPESAILSAVIFNALVIIALIPLALRGVQYHAQNAHTMLRNNLLIFGLGGIISPFIGIKLIDMIITHLKLV